MRDSRNGNVVSCLMGRLPRIAQPVFIILQSNEEENMKGE